eukprot:gnl/MRDRNA2_/MRDRNA2_90074_c0_seq1.p1 gnl/MRDRNA2_/MRDRNA2_90074_c0~~gnl/MRDRNA2_/MRDRNA2_90074_c0_seq1.p1  ORF type:complete len:622 (+),score=48.24 gnl/MRDRNA2_/MRDRNA2_90074_c0_seq1:63-1868(+)
MSPIGIHIYFDVFLHAAGLMRSPKKHGHIGVDGSSYPDLNRVSSGNVTTLSSDDMTLVGKIENHSLSENDPMSVGIAANGHMIWRKSSSTRQVQNDNSSMPETSDIQFTTLSENNSFWKVLLPFSFRPEFLSADLPHDLQNVSCRASLAVEALQNPQLLFFPDANGAPAIRAYLGDKMIGYNLLPSQNVSFPMALRTDMNREKELREVHCDFPLGASGRRKTIQRVGPFTSHGGFDFWELWWEDVGHFNKTLSKHPHGIALMGYSFLAVRDNGEILSLPPIHIHHVHAGANLSGFFSQASLTTAGDQQCMPELGGTTCLGKQFFDKHAFPVKRAWFIEALLNDVRPPNSQPLHWWFHIDFTWTADDLQSLKPLSYLEMVNPWKIPNTYSVATDRSSFMWYTTTMPRAGYLVWGVGHGHMAVSDHHYLFSASPGQLGLDQIPRADDPWEPITLERAGFSAVELVKRHMFANLRKAIKSHHSACTGRMRCNTTGPKLICDRPAMEEEVDAFLWDRTLPASMQCSPWTFERGETITAVFFNKPLNNKSCAIDLVRERSSKPKIFSQHGIWVLWYAAHDLQSYSEYKHFSQIAGVDGSFGLVRPS